MAQNPHQAERATQAPEVTCRGGNGWDTPAATEPAQTAPATARAYAKPVVLNAGKPRRWRWAFSAVANPLPATTRGDPGTVERGMPTGQRRLRPYRPSGMYRAQATPAQQTAAAGLREQLIQDHLHGDPSAGQQVI